MHIGEGRDTRGYCLMSSGSVMLCFFFFIHIYIYSTHTHFIYTCVCVACLLQIDMKFVFRKTVESGEWQQELSRAGVMKT